MRAGTDRPHGVGAPSDGPLEAGLTLGHLASAVLRDVREAEARVLPRFGAWLYHRQLANGSALSTPEWRRIWQVYQARKLARPA